MIKDIFNHEITLGDIVVWAGRVGNRPKTKMGIFIKETDLSYKIQKINPETNNLSENPIFVPKYENMKPIDPNAPRDKREIGFLIISPETFNIQLQEQIGDFISENA